MIQSDEAGAAGGGAMSAASSQLARIGAELRAHLAELKATHRGWWKD
jgi:hypothetical protein